MHACGEGVQPADAVGEPLLDQEFQRPIRDRRLVSETVLGQPLENVIGPHGAMRLQQDFQRPAPDRGQSGAPLGAEGIGPCENFAGAVRMIVALERQGRIG